MANDLIAKLKLDNSNWDTNINKARKSVKKFETDSNKSMLNVGSITNKLGGSFTKFAGLIGLAVSAGEALNKMMRSNQTTSDMFDNNINAAKDSVDLFFKSLTTGDWSAFNDGLLSTFNNLKTLSSMFDELADKKLSLTYIKADDLKDIEKFEQIAKDTNNNPDVMINAAQNMQGVINHLNKKTKETIDYQMKVLNQQYASKSGLKISDEDLKYFAKNTNFDGQLTSEANEAYKTFIKLNHEAEKLKANAIYDIRNNGIDDSRKYQKQYQDAKKVRDLFIEQNDFLIKQGWLTEENDKDRQETVKTLIEQLNVEREIYSLQKRADETSRSVKTSIASSSKSSNKKSDKEATKGSIAELDKQLSEWRTKFNNASTFEARAAADKMIKELTFKKIVLEAEIKYGKVDDIKPLDQPKINVKGKNATDDLKSGAIGNIKPIDNKLINKNIEYANSISAIGSVLSSVTNMTNEGASAWISYGANLISSVAAAIPSLISLTTALTAKAAAEGAASAAVVPVTGWITAVAAVGAIVAAMASIPKFATGGVVGGNSFVGDKVIARVNSGEMILNKSQQANLFNMLNNGSNRSNMNANVVFKVQGKELVGVLNNYNSKINKY